MAASVSAFHARLSELLLLTGWGKGGRAKEKVTSGCTYAHPDVGKDSICTFKNTPYCVFNDPLSWKIFRIEYFTNEFIFTRNGTYSHSHTQALCGHFIQTLVSEYGSTKIIAAAENEIG